jgi:hypothetical protein
LNDGNTAIRKQPPYEIVNGTYRTKGQVKVIKRFIEAVANSYSRLDSIERPFQDADRGGSAGRGRG